MQTNSPLKILAIDEITNFAAHPIYANMAKSWIVIELKKNHIFVNRFFNSKDYVYYMHDLAMYDGEKRVDFYRATLYDVKKRYVYICYL